MSESALTAFSSLVQSDSQLREQMRQAPALSFTQATLMKMQADKIKHLHDDHLNGATSWGEALLLCFGSHN